MGNSGFYRLDQQTPIATINPRVVKRVTCARLTKKDRMLYFSLFLAGFTLGVFAALKIFAPEKQEETWDPHHFPNHSLGLRKDAETILPPKIFTGGQTDDRRRTETHPSRYIAFTIFF